jgi:hypothetical protein
MMLKGGRPNPLGLLRDNVRSVKVLLLERVVAGLLEAEVEAVEAAVQAVPTRQEKNFSLLKIAVSLRLGRSENQLRKGNIFPSTDRKAR